MPCGPGTYGKKVGRPKKKKSKKRKWLNLSYFPYYWIQERYRLLFPMIRKLKEEDVMVRIEEIAEEVEVDYGNGGTY